MLLAAVSRGSRDRLAHVLREHKVAGIEAVRRLGGGAGAEGEDRGAGGAAAGARLRHRPIWR